MLEECTINNSLQTRCKYEERRSKYTCISYLNPKSYPSTSPPRIAGTCTVDDVLMFSDRSRPRPSSRFAYRNASLSYNWRAFNDSNGVKVLSDHSRRYTSLLHRILPSILVVQARLRDLGFDLLFCHTLLRAYCLHLPHPAHDSDAAGKTVERSALWCSHRSQPKGSGRTPDASAIKISICR